MEHRAAVVLGLSATGLTVARSLAPRGVPVWGADGGRSEIGHFSRWVRHDRRFSWSSPGPGLLDGLMEFGREQAEKPVLFTAGDPYIDFACTHHEVLREAFVLPRSLTPQDAGTIVDKRTFYERCSGLGVELPATYFPTSREEALAASKRLRYPAIVKPAHGHLLRRRLGGAKLIEVGSADELVEWWCRFDSWGAIAVLQELIPGPEANIRVAAVYSDADGVVRSLFTARKDRQYPPMYGSGSYMESLWDADIARLSEELVGQLGYRGICGTEYKWDQRSERWLLIEVNPRPTLWYALSRAAGVDVVWDAFRDLSGSPRPVRPDTQRDGVRWQLLVRDVLSAAHFARRGELGLRALLRSAVDPRNKEYAVLSFRDPGTALGYPIDTVSKYLSHVRGGRG